MCGRYNFTAAEAEEIQQIVREINDRLNGPSIKTGEIYPTDLVPVLVPGQDQPQCVAMTWGFPHFKNNGVIINARSETVTDKKMFRDSVMTRRCVVPSTGFYEWSRSGKEKVKYRFRRPGENMLYMAGFWNTFREKDGSGDKQRFVILTTAANESMREDVGTLSLCPDLEAPGMIHDRMPLILDPQEQAQWLAQGADFARLFDREHIELVKEVV